MDVMNRHLLRNAFGWGFFLWLVGYILGFIFFFVVPPSLIGWVITPIGIALTLWVLFKKVGKQSWPETLTMAGIWTAIAVIFDYLFIVKLLNPADGYYKFDVYLYYVLTFALPVAAAWWIRRQTV